MNFSDRIRAIRKEHGMSQEELADKLNVSRQAISKWENDQGFPEMDKLLSISNIFNVSLDYLLKDGDPEPEQSTDDSGYYVSAELTEKYLDTKRSSGLQLAIGVAIIIFSLSFTMFFPRYLGTILFFLGAAVGISVLVMLAFQPKFEGYEEVEKRPLVFEKDFLTSFKKQYPSKQKKFGLIIVSGIVVFILSLVASVIVHELTGNDMRYIATLPLFWGLATGLIIYGGTMIGALSVIVNNQEHIAEKSNENEGDWIYAIVMPLTSIIYLVIGFMWNAWHPGWLIFPLATIVCYAFTIWRGANTRT